MKQAILVKVKEAAARLGRLGRLAARRPFAPGPGSSPRLDRILFLDYGGIGDMIFLLPALRALRQKLPKARIVFAANRSVSATELFPATGLADETWELEPIRTSGRLDPATARRIREARFDAVLLSHAVPAPMFSRALLSIPLRVGHCMPIEAPHASWSAARYALWRLRRAYITGELERRLLLNRPVWIIEEKEHMVRRNLRLIRELGLAIGAEDEARPDLPESPESRRFAEEALPRRGVPCVGLHLGSPFSQYGKLWPVEAWAQVCRQLMDRARFELVLLGGPEETRTVREFIQAFGRPVKDLSGKGGLLGTFSALRRLDLLLCIDSGISKAAMALKVPTATVWGPTGHGLGAYWDPEIHLEIRHDVPCSPCVYLGYPMEGAGVVNFSNCGHRACLTELSPRDVIAAVSARFGETVLARSSA